MNKVIFLDVDGVLNNSTWTIEMFDKGIRVYHDDLLYEPSLEQLRRIVDRRIHTVGGETRGRIEH